MVKHKTIWIVKKMLRSFTNKIVNTMCGLTLRLILTHAKNTIEGGQKNPIKVNGQNHHMDDKKEGQKMCHPQEPKKGES
jgi:hypothetical protein